MVGQGITRAFLALAFCGVSQAISAELPILRTYAEISAFLEGHPKASLEEFMAQLSPGLRERYQLVYESRSPNRSSLEWPRIILTNSDATLILGIPGNPEEARGNTIELIETDPKTKVLRFREIVFRKDGIENNPAPKTCVACHGNAKSEFSRSGMRPIWDGYPDWPGVFGSSHNDMKFHAPAKYGAGHYPSFEFEEAAFAKLQAKSTADGRYGLLTGLREVSTAKLASMGTMLTEALLRRNLLNLAGLYEERIQEAFLRSPEEYRKLRSEILAYLANGALPDRISPEQVKAFETSMENAYDREVDQKFDRFKKLVQTHGTASDRLLLTTSRPFFPEDRPALARGSAKRLLPLAIAGVDPHGFAITRELNVGGLGTAYVGNLDRIWQNSLRASIASEKHPTLGSNGCLVLISPVNVRSTDAVMDQWIRMLGGR
jgi:hypothetical protein